MCAEAITVKMFENKKCFHIVDRCELIPSSNRVHPFESVGIFDKC